MKGKTITFGLLVLVLGFLEKFDVTSLPTEAQEWALPVIGAGIIILRFLTTGPVKTK